MKAEYERYEKDLDESCRTESGSLRRERDNHQMVEAVIKRVKLLEDEAGLTARYYTAGPDSDG